MFFFKEGFETQNIKFWGVLKKYVFAGWWCLQPHPPPLTCPYKIYFKVWIDWILQLQKKALEHSKDLYTLKFSKLCRNSDTDELEKYTCKIWNLKFVIKHPIHLKTFLKLQILILTMTFSYKIISDR